jgi:hypothetical protein
MIFNSGANIDGGGTVRGNMEPGSEDKLHEKKLEGPTAADAEKREQPPKKSKGSAWRRAVVPSLYITGTGVLLYAAWRWLRPKDASKELKSTWTLDDTLGPYD